ELRAVRVARIRGGRGQLPWLDRLRSEVHGRHFAALGGLSLSGPDERPGRRGPPPLRRFDADGRGGCVLRWLHDLLDRRAHRPLQDADRTRRGVQSGEHGGDDGRAVVHGLGIRRHAVREPRAVRKVVAVEFRAELEDADPDRPFPARFSRGPVGGLPGVHRRESARRARQVPLLPRRGPLGAAAAQPPPVVGNGARLARSILEAHADGGPVMGAGGGEPFLKTLTRTTVAAGALGVVFLLAFPRHASLASDFVDAFTVAFCFTFLGHYVDRLLLALPGIRAGVGPLVRVVGWFAGGLWCAVVARWLWMQYG